MFLFYVFIIYIIVNLIEISIHGFIYTQTEFHKTLEEKTNEYMKSKGLDITIKTDFENSLTSSSEPSHIANSIEQSLLKKEKGYDLYLTDTAYTGRFSQYFENLNNYIDKKVIELYKDGTATKTCIVDKNLIGLPLTVDYGGLYANMDLLEKYNKSVPETWDELIETTNYIYERESPTNPELHKFLAHFSPYENGLATILEYIHSFRDSDTDEFPSYTSKNAIEALEKMKQIKETASTKDDFASDEMAVMRSFFDGNYIFLRYWYMGEMYPFLSHKFTFNHLPGKKRGVSASCIGGSNISMNKYISEERKKAASEVISFLNSYDHQKYGILNSNIRSAIHSTYQDEEICENINCTKFSTIQSIVRPNSSSINYEEYSDKFRELVKKYIDGETNKSAKDILIEIDDIRKIHFIEASSFISIVILLAAFLTLGLLLASYVYISNNRNINQFNFLPFKYWCVFIFGIFIMTFYCFTGIGTLNKSKCIIKPFLLSIGFDLIYIPIFLKMISIIQIKNQFSKFVKNYFNLVFILIFIINIVLNVTWYIFDPFTVNTFIIKSGKNFQYCSSKGGLGDALKYIIIGLKLLVLIVMGILVFIEWNLAAFKQDIRSVTSTIYTNILIIGLFIIIGKININNRYLYFGLRALLVLIFCLSTLVIIIGTKYYQISIKKENQYESITTLNDSSSGGVYNSNYKTAFSNSSNSKQHQSPQIKNAFLNYHYRTGSGSSLQSITKSYHYRTGSNSSLQSITKRYHYRNGSDSITRPYQALFQSTVNSANFDKVFGNNNRSDSYISNSNSNDNSYGRNYDNI